MAADPTPEFDLYTAPLAGLNLVEASAGTGKTWNISGLYTRLILEPGLRVEEILVVTYTKAATAELQDRIRKRLRGVLAAFETGSGEDEFCRRVLDLYGDRRDLARNRLTRAIGGFDQAAIFTIHGFCQRLLLESAFESGSDFDCEVLPDERELLGEIVDDFWRREVYPASAAWAAFLAERKQSPETWLGEIAGHVGKPFLKVLGPAMPADFMAAEARRAAEIRRAAALWEGQRDEIRARLLRFEGFNGNKVKPDRLRDWLSGLEDWFGRRPESDEVRASSIGLPEGVGKLRSTSLAAAARKGHAAPQHPFFDACERLAEADQALGEAFEDRLKALKPRLLEFCNSELEARKSAARVFSYNDLLNRLAAALRAKSGRSLAETVRRRYPAALIDEFQDTDPMQYRIFREVYGDGELPVFFVGDPKQAIYGFRGADVFSYLEARGEPAVSRRTLKENQRSEPDLIAAVNALFLNSPRPFLLEAIPYPEVLPAPRERPALAVDGDAGGPLRFLLLPPAHDEQGEEIPQTKSRASQLAATGTAAEIARLLQAAAAGKARLGERSLNGGDIAVLVATHAQARLVEEALQRLGVPSVRQGQDNVFESPEALELERVLAAIAEPGREPLVKAALATELMGCTANRIDALQRDEPAWERLFDRFQGYHQLWLSLGFSPMFRRWFEESKVTGNLPEFRNGERRLTNLLHLAELLQVESRRKPDIDTLLTWFARAIRQPSHAGEEAQLRLESDAQRVKIVTIHASKGLEYPIVFCPFLWDGKLMQRKAAAVLFHAGSEAVLDLGSPDLEDHRPQAVREEMSEKLRLLYVALTRAIHRCYAVWGSVHNAKDAGEGLHTTALAWLLHGGADSEGDPLAALERRLGNAGRAAIEADLKRLSLRTSGAVSIAPLAETARRYQPPAPAQPPGLTSLCFQRAGLRPRWRMSSFTGLTTGRHSEAPDYDLPAEDEEPAEAAGDSMFDFPRGAKAGSCLHAILEDWEFTCTDGTKLAELCRRKLKAHGLAESWTETVRRNLEGLLATPLDKSGMTLAGLPPDRRLVEMEFTYSLQGGSAFGLGRLLADPALGADPRFAEAAGRLDFHRIAGFMKGYIDLAFEAGGKYYLVDYKSNWLGNRHSHYAGSRLVEAVAREHYYLQYLIYTLALHRYLKLRIPDYDYDTHFGGVYYLFLRGISPGKATGVFRDRPRSELLHGLEKLFGEASDR